ncbi:MAG: N-acetylmuramoyl-L-alanine amidase [Polyangiaceae bacterium]
MSKPKVPPKPKKAPVKAVKVPAKKTPAKKGAGTNTAAGKKPGGALKPGSPKRTPAPTRPSTASDRLTLHVCSAFAVPDPQQPGQYKRTWGNDGADRKPVLGAVVAVLNEGRTSRPVDVHGQTTLSLKGLPDGAYTLRFVPSASQLGSVPAGPALVPGKATALYRPVDVTVRWANGKLSSTPAPVVAGGASHARVLSFDDHTLSVDWKPDWLQAAKSQARDKDPGSQENGAASAPKISAVVLHRTGYSTIGTTLSQFAQPKPTDPVVNAHYVVDVDGFVVKMVRDEDQAAHAGPGAQWNLARDGRKAISVNRYSIGIEHVNAKGTRFTDAQMTALESLLKALMAKYPDIKKDRILGHCEVSPLKENPGKDPSNERDDCPGKEFDWPRLEQKGLAAAPYPQRQLPHQFFRDQASDSLGEGNDDARARYGKERRPRVPYRGLIRRIQGELAEIGYDKVPTATERRWLTGAKQTVFLEEGQYDHAMSLAVLRFQRRYLGDTRRIDGAAPAFVEGRVNAITSELIVRVRNGRGLP